MWFSSLYLFGWCCAEQNEKGVWDQKHWEDLMLKVKLRHDHVFCADNDTDV